MSSDPAPIPFTVPDLGPGEMAAVQRAVADGTVGGNGPICRRVQERLAEVAGCRHALLTPSATQAMEVGFYALEIGPGDEVLMPSFAFVSQANAILARGAKPVFCEIDARTMNMCPEDAARRITDRTRLIMPVHYAGVAADMDAYVALAKEHGCAVLEDAAQCIGASLRGRHLGTIGDLGALSFHGTKNVVCGEGGALLTNDDELARKAEIVQEKGTNRSAFLRGEVDKYTWVGPGGSYVLSDLLAAILEVQLQRLDELHAARRVAWNLYHEGLAPLEERGLLRRPCIPDGAEHNAHIYALRARDPGVQDAILTGLKARAIHATFHFQPLHASSYARDVLGVDPEPMPVTEEAAATIVRLPLFATITAEQATRVVEAIHEVVAATA